MMSGKSCWRCSRRLAHGEAARGATIGAFLKCCIISRCITSLSALPAEFLPWSTLWRRFWRLSQNGTFEAFFRVLASCSRTAGIIQMFDSTSIRAHTRRLAQKGAAKPGARRLRHQDPHQVRPRRPAARLSPHRQRGQR
ncbi:MAG: hypothetical protein EBX37_07880 [Alphaproteobacteria bacterium]|nr:hypothetical protein [Alphaproteobacteria bacterium]